MTTKGMRKLNGKLRKGYWAFGGFVVPSEENIYWETKDGVVVISNIQKPSFEVKRVEYTEPSGSIADCFKGSFWQDCISGKNYFK